MIKRFRTRLNFSQILKNFGFKGAKETRYFSERNILLEKQKAIYFFIPKVACSSIKKICSDLLCLESDSIIQIHINKYPFIFRKKIAKYNNYFKFTFVRNPWDRIVSCYKNKIREKSLNNQHFVNGVFSRFITYGTFTPEMSFEDFVKAICEISDEDANVHFQSQYKFITDKKGKIIVDFIGQFENIDKDFNKICKKLKINVKLPHLMKSEKKDYKEYYTKETKEMIRKRYKKDIEMFGYNF
ncbi:sulfotransferase family protein [Candidatus Woesearchaeota archaeon]|nr:sulfotransferase family protein [Candidatus Woesearchaeota archaeon]